MSTEVELASWRSRYDVKPGRPRMYAGHGPELEVVSIRRHDMARITYDNQTAAAYQAVREIPRDGLGHWRDAIGRHLSPFPGMTVADIGAGTGQFAAAFSS